MPASAARRGPVHQLRRPSRWLGPALVLATLLSTQFHVNVPLAASVGGVQRLDLSEVVFGVLGLILAVRLIIFGEHRRLDGQARYLLQAYLLLVVVWLGIVLGRGILALRWVISVTLVEYLGFALVWYLIFRLGWLSKRSMILGALGLVTITNAWGLFLVLFDGSRVRASGLLSNINVYIGMVLLLIPLLLHWATRMRIRWLRLLAFANVAICVAMVMTSGSRFALFTLPVILAASAVLIARTGGVGRLRDLGIVAAVSVLVVGVLILVNPGLLGDLTRAASLEETTRPSGATTMASPAPGRATASHSGGTAQASSVTPTTAPTRSSDGRSTPSISGSRTPSDSQSPPRPGPSVQPVDTGDPDYEPPNDRPRELTHGRILKRSLAVLGNNWVWGTGRPVIFFNGWGYHPPHNLLLEVLVFVGIVGAVPYFMVALFIPTVALVRLRWRVFASSYLIGLAALFGYSLLQPLITDQLVLLVLAWGIFGAMMGPDEPDWEGLLEP